MSGDGEHARGSGQPRDQCLPGPESPGRGRSPAIKCRSPFRSTGSPALQVVWGMERAQRWAPVRALGLSWPIYKADRTPCPVSIMAHWWGAREKTRKPYPSGPQRQAPSPRPPKRGCAPPRPAAQRCPQMALCKVARALAIATPAECAPPEARASCWSPASPAYTSGGAGNVTRDRALLCPVQVVLRSGHPSRASGRGSKVPHLSRHPCGGHPHIQGKLTLD